MPLIEIDAARLDKIAAEIGRMTGKLPPLSVEREAANGLLRQGDAAMVAFIIERYFEMVEKAGLNAE